MFNVNAYDDVVPLSVHLLPCANKLLLVLRYRIFLFVPICVRVDRRKIEFFDFTPDTATRIFLTTHSLLVFFLSDSHKILFERWGVGKVTNCYRSTCVIEVYTV